MEIIKWFASTVISLAVIGALASAAFAVASFMFFVQLGAGILLLAMGLSVAIKESLFGKKDE